MQVFRPHLVGLVVLSAVCLGVFYGSAVADTGGISFIEPLATPLVFALDANNNGPFGPDSAYGIAKGDFNGDGKLDLAVTASQIAARPAPDQAFIYVMLGNGDGVFQPPSALPIPLSNGSRAQAYGILAKDFDRDTKVDLLTVSPELQQVLFFKGHGDGTFDPPVTTATTGQPVAVQTGDLNKDGILDIVTLSSFGQMQIGVLIGNGDGTFQTSSAHTVNTGQSDLVVADFNRDNAPDLLVTSWNASNVYVLLNDGHGAFAATATTLPSWNKQVNGVYVGKFDGDDFLDLVVSGYGNGPGCGATDWLFIKGNGNGTFVDPTPGNCISRSTGSLSANNRLFSENITSDLNGDGYLDVVFVDASNYLDVGLGDGMGHFTTSRIIGSPGAGFDRPGQYTIDSVNSYALVTGDFNGDTIVDIAVAGGATNGGRFGGVSVVLGATPGAFQTARSYDVMPVGNQTNASPNLTPRSTLLADFNHDNKLDLIFTQIFGYGAQLINQPQIILGQGDGKLLGTPSGPLNSCYLDLAAADFDKDGNLDFACPYTGVNVAWGDGNGAFPAGTTIPVDADVQQFSWGGGALAVGDVNGDTYPDVAWLEYNFYQFAAGRIAVDLYDPTSPRTFKRTLSFDTGRIDGGTQGVALGDFNGDRHLDIVFHSTIDADANNHERFMVFLGNGDGSFQAPLVTQPGLPIIEQLKTFDFDRDGHTDVMAVGYTGGFFILLGHGDGTFEAPVGYPNTTYDSHEAQIVDLDADGIADVVLSSTTSTLSIFKGNSDGTFQAPVRVATGRDRTDTVVAGDLNGDSKPDLVAGVFLAGSQHADFTVLINNSPTFPNLIVNRVSAPSTGAPGDIVAIDYPVQNTAPAFANDEWDDAVYFSTDSALDAADVLVGTVHHTGGLTAGAAYSVNAMFPVPPVPPGAYRVLVHTDDGDTLSEADETDNTGVSAATIAVQDVPQAIAGTPVAVSTMAGQFLYFRYVAQAGSDVRFAADIDVPSRLEVYERFGNLPTRTAFDQKYPTADFHQELRINPAVGGTYYLLFYNSSANGAGVRLTVTEVPPPTPTPTLTATETPAPTPSVTPTVPVLVGDCHSKGAVTIDDLLSMVNIALETAPITACPAGDPDHSGTITIDEILRAVAIALST